MPVTGGTFSDPSGAGVTVAPGTIPTDVNAVRPTMKPSPGVPTGMTIDPSIGDVNVTTGAPGYDFNLTGQSGFTTTTPGAVRISLPFNVAAIPVADQEDPLKIFMRVFDPQDDDEIELSGEISGSGSSRILTVETRGLPLEFTAVVIYNPNMDAVASDDADVSAVEQRAQPAPQVAVTKTTWPAQSWCVKYNPAHPRLIATVKSLYGIAGNPTTAQIRSAIAGIVLSAKQAQVIYQNDGLNAPNLYIGSFCRDYRVPARQRYNLHMKDWPRIGSFRPNDPDAPELSAGRHYGRVYVDFSLLTGQVQTASGQKFSTLDVIAHEMLHGIQDNYQIWGTTPNGYKEGSAATYGRSIASGQVITVRNELFFLRQSLMSPANGEKYDNQDFFAYVGKQYNGGSLNYMSGLYARMDAAIGASNPPAATMYGAMDAYFQAAFSQPLKAIYLDFVKERALTHRTESQFGRAGEVVTGFAENLFGNAAGATSIYKPNVDVATCKRDKIQRTWRRIPSFATRAIVVSPTGVLPAGETYPTLVVKITPASSAIGDLWGGFTHRAGTTTALAAINKFRGFGNQADDKVVVLVSNRDPPNNSGVFQFEIACEGPTIDSISPAKGPVDTSVTINGSGFGTASDTRSVTFNGVTAATVTFNSDTQAVAKVPANASTGDVIVTVNGDKSNGVNFEVIAQCSATQNAGGDTPDTRTIELGKPAGTFLFNYQTYSQKDQIIVRYQGNTLFDTGCVGTSGSQSLSYGGTSTQITVQVIPNCAGGSGTAWNYSVSCP